jgi:2-hydroxychromene-2-carboxylate isomerase
VAEPIRATLYTDPGCPWAYSALPALRVVDWRYGDQLSWRLVVIGIAETASAYRERGYTPAGVLGGLADYRDRFGMPFAPHLKERVSGTARACRAIVVARILRPGSEWDALRALQLANFTTPLLLDDEDQLHAVLAGVPGVDADAVIARLDDPEVSAAYERDRAEARTAAGSPAQLQGKTAHHDGPERFTAPSLVLETDGARLVAGGWQTIEAYDVLVANLAPGLRRAPPPDDPHALLRRHPEGLVTQEVAALLTRGNDAPDRRAAESALLDLVAEGRASRRQLGDDALWLAAP